MQQKPKIVVSTPSRLHSHQQVYGLQKAGYLQKYIVPVWNKQHQFPFKYFSYFPSKLRLKINAFLSKRYYKPIDSYYVEQHPFFEMVRVLINEIFGKKFNQKLLYWQNIIHDHITARRLKKLKPDIFIGYEISCAKSFEVCKKLGITTILDLPNVHYKFSDPLEEEYEGKNYNANLVKKISARKEKELSLADYILCISTLACQTLIDNNIDKKKIILLYLGADISIFKARQEKEQYNFSILFVGVIIKRKGVHLLLQAFKELQLENAKLTLIGPIADTSILQEYQNIYEHIPYLSHTELVEHYQKADIFVLPSYLDSWGMVVNEAMASGTSVLITENVGSKDLVDQDSGFVIPVGSVEALKEKIKYCYENKERLRLMGKNAEKKVQQYTWENYHNNLCKSLILKMEKKC